MGKVEALQMGNLFLSFIFATKLLLNSNEDEGPFNSHVFPHNMRVSIAVTVRTELSASCM